MSKINFRYLAVNCLISSLLVSCSSGFYNSVNKAETKTSEKTQTSENSNAAGEDAASSAPESNASGEFFQEGKSLDLYVIMDKSSSLFHGVVTYSRDYADPSKRGLIEYKPMLGSDPTCKRYEALKGLVISLGKKLNKGEQVRMNVVTFANESQTIGSFENVLSDTEGNLQSLRSGICDAPSGQGPYTSLTHYAKGISESLSNFKANSENKKLDLQTVLFFSDGAPKDDAPELLRSLERLKGAFPKRVFGILLGTTPDECSLPRVNSVKKTTIECMLDVVGGNPKRLRQAETAEKLLNEMNSLLEKQ